MQQRLSGLHRRRRRSSRARRSDGGEEGGGAREAGGLHRAHVAQLGLPTCGAAVLGEAEASRLLPELDSEVAVANGSRAAVGEAVGDAAPFTTLRNWEMQGVRDGAGRDLQILGRE